MDRRTAIALLGDADRDVRLQAVMTLGEARAVEAAGQLVARYGVERDFHIRESLTWATLRIGEIALPLVRQALGSPRWLARLQAAHTLSKRGDRQDGDRLLPLLDDPVPCVAARAWWAAAQCGDPKVLHALAGQLGRGDAALRNSLSVALASFGDAAVPWLVGALRVDDPGVRALTADTRAHAADTLAQLGTPAAEPAGQALADATDDPDLDVRVAALNALGQLVSPDAWQHVDRHTDGPDRRLALLARRLGERRPSDRAVRLARARGDLDRSPVRAARVVPAGPWPGPDPTLVTLEGGPWRAALVGPLALQIQVCRPRHLTRADVPAEELASVHASARARALADGHDGALAGRVADGAVEQHVHQVVLMEQVSVADPGRLIADLLRGTEVRVTAMASVSSSMR